MRRIRGVGARRFLLMVLLVVIVPTLVSAAPLSGDTSYLGTYGGSGSAKWSGGEASRKITVFVEPDAAGLKVTVRAGGLTLTGTGPITAVKASSVHSQITFDDLMVTGEATVIMRRVDGGGWKLAASGSGTALGFEGTGRARAVQSASTGSTSLGAQVGSMVGALSGGEKTAPAVKAGGARTSMTEPVVHKAPLTAAQEAYASALAALTLLIIILMV